MLTKRTMTSEQEEALYKKLFFTWPEGHRDYERLTERLEELLDSERTKERQEHDLEFVRQFLGMNNVEDGKL